MKKLLVMATVLVAGMVSAKGTTGKAIVEKAKVEKKVESKQKKSPLLKVCSNWVTVTSECGTKFYLCSDRYKTSEDLVEAADEISDIKCN